MDVISKMVHDTAKIIKFCDHKGIKGLTKVIFFMFSVVEWSVN